MKHASSRDLYTYWNERRGKRPAPDRGDIEPGAIRTVLGDSFIVAYEPRSEHPFRLAGTRVCALFGRELKTQSFVQIWDKNSRSAVQDLLAIVADEGVGLVAGATGEVADGTKVELELLLLPLRHRGRAHARMIGVLAPLDPPVWLGTSSLVSLKLGSLRHVGPAVETVAAPRFMGIPFLAARDGGRRHGKLMVYDGGVQ
jgi:hypothetical protein